MNDTALEKISRGERVLERIQGDTEALDSLMNWLQEFKRIECGGNRSSVNFNRFTSREGLESLEIDFGFIPPDKRDRLIDKLRKVLAL